MSDIIQLDGNDTIHTDINTVETKIPVYISDRKDQHLNFREKRTPVRKVLKRNHLIQKGFTFVNNYESQSKIYIQQN